MGVLTKGKRYYLGEFPPALNCELRDKNNDLDTTIAGATLTALVLIDDGADTERTITCTNPGTGKFTIDWETNTANPSDFPGTLGGLMRVDIKVVPSGGGLWYMDRFSLPVDAR